MTIGTTLSSGLNTRACAADNRGTLVAPGSVCQPDQRKTLYDPFERETSIRVISVVREAEPTAQIVESKSDCWDGSALTMSARDIWAVQDLLAPINLNPSKLARHLSGAVTPLWTATDVYATVFAYRTTSYPKLAYRRPGRISGTSRTSPVEAR